MKWLKSLYNRYVICFSAIIIAMILLLGRPLLPAPCFQDQSLKLDSRSIEAGNKFAERVLPRYLLMFEEEPLWDFKRPIEEGYRLIFTPAFRPNQLVSIWKAGQEYFITVKQSRQTSRQVGKEIFLNYKLENVKYRSLKPSDWQEFKKLTAVTCYWGMAQDEMSGGKDGKAFLLEGRQGSRYHSVYRWEPSNISYYRRLCEYLLNLVNRYS